MRLTTRDFKFWHFSMSRCGNLSTDKGKFFISDSSAWVRLHILSKNKFIVSKSISALKNISQQCFISAHEIFLANGTAGLGKVKIYQSSR